MIRSMTGYGRAQRVSDDCSITVEMRSVNNRFLKMSVRSSDVWERLSSRVESLVKEQVFRGTLYVNMRKKGAANGSKNYRVNVEMIQEYRKQLGNLKGANEIGLKDLLLLPGAVSTSEEEEVELEEEWNNLSGLVAEALAELVEMRKREGEHLRTVLLEVVERLREFAAKIRADAPGMVKDYRDRLVARVGQLLDGTDVSVSDADLARELAVFAERSDILEELDRMDSHIKQFIGLLDTDGSVGRKLEFIVQEMFREANTMGSKVADVELAKVVLEAKTEVDRLKEQVLNVE